MAKSDRQRRRQAAEGEALGIREAARGRRGSTWLRVVAAWAAACVGAACWPAMAAAEPPAASTESPEGALTRLRPGQYVRLTLGESETVQGRLAAVRDGRVVMTGAEEGPAIEGIREVWVRERPTRQGALIGAGVGSVVCGAGLAFLVYATDRDSHWGQAGVYGAVLGGAVGAATGAAVSTAFTRWERVGVRAPEEGAVSLRIKATQGLSLSATGSWDSTLTSGPPVIKAASSPGLAPLRVSGGVTVSW